VLPAKGRFSKGGQSLVLWGLSRRQESRRVSGCRLEREKLEDSGDQMSQGSTNLLKGDASVFIGVPGVDRED